MENRTLTIMFTDMKGFTPRTSAQSRVENMDMIRQHRDLLLPVLAKYGARLVKTIGDAFLVTFESPTDAVIAGVDLQNTLTEHNAPLDGAERVEIRIGINTGEVTVEEGDVYGEAVNIASRIEGVAEPGEIYFTESTYLSMNKSEVPSAEIGYRLLKGIPEKVKVFRVLHEGEMETGPRRGAPSGYGSTQSAPRWRRALAFAIDLVLVSAVVGVLLSGDSRYIDEFRGDMEQSEDRLADDIQQLLATRDALHGLSDDEIREAIGDPEEEIPDIIRGEMRADIVRFREDSERLWRIEDDYRVSESVLFLIILLLYATIATGWRGRTFGKKILRLRVRRAGGETISWGVAILRTLLYLLCAAPLMLGFIWALFDKERQGWHDKIADTRVVHEVK